ncbi:MAG: hypothetical protein DI582_01645 [Azospirillum brasilense]|nr:MAG: hypothetical protein DI582_01645 [Azospirillum brasilense]
MKPLLLSMAACLLAGAAHAQSPQVTLDYNDAKLSDVAVPREGNMFDHFRELGEDFNQLRVRGATPDSFRYRFTTQAAIGAEGPWQTLDLEADSPWQELPVTQNGDEVVIVLDDGAGKGLFATEPMTLVGTPRNYPAGEDVVSTMRPERDCLNASGAFDAQAGACYTYRSQDRIRFNGTDGKAYEITIGHPGGC